MNLFSFLVLSTFCLFSSFAQVSNTYEQIPPNEKESIAKLIQGISSQVTTHRDAHARGHGCVDEATVRVRKDLPKELHVGFFQPGMEYPAIIRFSPGSGDIRVPDQDGGAQGFGLKILLNEEQQKELLPVFGENKMYVDKSLYKSFDIIAISRVSEFFIETVEDYFPFFQTQGQIAVAVMKAKAEGKSPAEIQAISRQLLVDGFIAPKMGKQRFREAAILAKLGAARPKNVLMETFGSFVPSLYGTKAVKYRIEPCEGPQNADAYIVPDHIDTKTNPHFLREVLRHELKSSAQCFTLSVQFHQEEFPSVEDAVASWPEDKSPYQEIATIRIPQKSEGQELMSDEVCERASFHPGHASKEHYPIGGIQRARIGGTDYEGIYTAIHRLRNENRSKNEN